MKPDQQHISKLLTDTITLLCKNGLTFQRKLLVQGLIGITVDESDVFIIHFNEQLDEKVNNPNETLFHNGDIKPSLSPPASSKPMSDDTLLPSQSTISKYSSKRRSQARVTSKNTKSLICYDQPFAMGAYKDESNSSEDGAVVIESEKEGSRDGFGQEHKLVAIPNNVHFKQTVAINYETQFGQDISNQVRNNETIFTQLPKLESKHDFDNSNEYSSLSSAEAQYFGGYGETDDQCGEIQAVQEGILENEAKLNLTDSLASVPLWETDYSQQCLSNDYSQPTRKRDSVTYQEASKNLVTSAHPHRWQTKGHSRNYSRTCPKLLQSSLSAARRMPQNPNSSTPISYSAKLLFICDLCNRSFTDRSNMLRHQITKHGRQKLKRGRPSKSCSLYSYDNVEVGN